MFQLPKTEDKWNNVSTDFGNRWNFFNCIGSIDGKHVNLVKPINSGSHYYNYKGTYSIVLMAIANANYEFIMVDVGANGRVSDGGVIRNTSFWNLFEDKLLNIPEPKELPNTNEKYPFVFVADEAFQLRENLMKPYNRHVLNDQRRIFNYRLSRARRIIENVFGILASRFKILKKPMNLSPDKARTVVMTCCYLHNLLIKQKSYIQRGEVDIEDTATGNIEPGSWRDDSQILELQRSRAGNATLMAKQVRDDFCEYFNTVGAVSWQDRMI